MPLSAGGRRVILFGAIASVMAAWSLFIFSRWQPCATLREELGVGWPPDSASKLSCRRARKEAQQAARAFPSLSAWGRTVFVQRMALLEHTLQALYAAAKAGRVSPGFTRYPPQLVCSGVAPTAEEWQRGPLGTLGVTRPERLFYSIEAKREAGNGAVLRYRLRLFQDLNCDGRTGTTEALVSVDPHRSFLEGVKYESLVHDSSAFE